MCNKRSSMDAHSALRKSGCFSPHSGAGVCLADSLFLSVSAEAEVTA